MFEVILSLAILAVGNLLTELSFNPASGGKRSCFLNTLFIEFMGFCHHCADADTLTEHKIIRKKYLI